MEKSERHQIDYDGVWKEILDILLPQFLKLFCPDIYSDIDWSIPPVSLEKELHKINPEAEVGNRSVDKLFRVYCKQGQEAWVYIHLEFQAQWISDLAERIYAYHSGLYLRYKKPILSLAVLGDDCPNWRPERFESKIWGCRALLEFRTVKLWDYRNRTEELKQIDNPFAYFVLAHLSTLATQRDPSQRLLDKEAIALEMLERGFDQREVRYLFKFIDTLMMLPKDLEQTFLNKIYKYQEENKMPILAPFEQIAKEDGIKEGFKKGHEEGHEEGREEGILSEAQTAVVDILNDRLGEIPASLIETIQNIHDLSWLRGLRRQAIKVNSLVEMEQFIQEGKK